ncbi:hypothetical protein [Nostoc sp.]|uniref:hypothetical protein n=1 Tax=Nostoc sp. TaxID=1180 RepID=UPI002FF92503
MPIIFSISGMGGTIILLHTELNAHLVKRRWRSAYSMLFKAMSTTGYAYAWLLC